MAAAAAEWLVRGAVLYCAAGIIFAIVFLTKGIAKLDPAAAHTRAPFRLIIAPGVIALWPYLAMAMKGRWG